MNLSLEDDRDILRQTLKHLYLEIEKEYDVTYNQIVKIVTMRHGPFRVRSGFLDPCTDIELDEKQLSDRIRWYLRYLTGKPGRPWPPPRGSHEMRVASALLHRAVGKSIIERKDR